MVDESSIRTGGAGGPPGRLQTIGHWQRATRHRRFVGRASQFGLLHAAVGADDPPFAVLFVHGPGGIGKTALLGRFAQIAESASVPVVQVDLRTVDATPDGFIAEFAKSVGWSPAEVTSGGPAGCGRVVVLVDAFERADAPFERWLREWFIAGLASGSLVVVAGRGAPSGDWLLDAGWQELTRVLPLRELSAGESRALLEQRGVDATLHERLVEVTHGHPLALSLVIDVLQQRPDWRRSDMDLLDAPDVVRVLMDRFIDELPDGRHREALAVCAHARFTTEDLLRGAMAGDDMGELFGWLRSCSFVEESRFGLLPHDLARDVLDADLRWRDRVAHEELHHRVRAHIVRRIGDASGLDRQRAMADLLYLHRLNPLMRPLFDWAHLGDVRVELADEQEHEQLVAMTRRHQGPEQAALVRHWLQRQPRAFFVFRQAERDPVGFTALLHLDQASGDDISRDPGTRAMWEYAMRGAPPRPGETVTATRFFVDRDAGQRVPSPSWTAFSIWHGLRPFGAALAWDFIGAFHTREVAPVLEYIDYRNVPDVGFEVDGRRYAVFVHDWRRLGPEEWAQMMGRRELDTDAGSAHVQPAAEAIPVLSRPEFAAAVRSALRDRHRPDRLAANPLTRPRALRARFGLDAAPEQLGRLLDEAAEHLAADPRDAKAFRAVDRTYLHPAPTQERAAEVLDLPFSTYRRHLARGIDRIVEHLWDLEVHGPR